MNGFWKNIRLKQEKVFIFTSVLAVLLGIMLTLSLLTHVQAQSGEVSTQASRLSSVLSVFDDADPNTATNANMAVNIGELYSSPDGCRNLFAYQSGYSYGPLYLRDCNKLNVALITTTGTFEKASKDGCKVLYIDYQGTDPRDQNGDNDLYLFDCSTETSKIISIGNNGENPGRIDYYDSYGPRAVFMSDDGCNIIFHTGRSFDPRDVDYPSDPYFNDLYLYSCHSPGVPLQMVSIGNNGRQGFGQSHFNYASSDGCVVWFQSTAALEPQDLDGEYGNTDNSDIYRYDCIAKHLTLISIGNNGEQGTGSVSVVGVDVSGCYAVLNGNAALVSTDIDGQYDVYYYDCGSHSLSIITDENGKDFSFSASLAYTYFGTTGCEVIYTISYNGYNSNTYHRDCIGHIELVSKDPLGNPQAIIPLTVYNSCRILFSSLAGFDPRDVDGNYDLYLYDCNDRSFTFITIGNLGERPQRYSYNFNDFSVIKSSSDLCRVVFHTTTSGLEPRDADGYAQDVYMWDCATKHLELVSIGNRGETGNGDAGAQFASNDACKVAFYTNAALDPQDTDGDGASGAADVYHYNCDAPEGERLSLVSYANSPLQGSGYAYATSMTDEGCDIHFSTSMTLDPDVDTDRGSQDIYAAKIGACNGSPAYPPTPTFTPTIVQPTNTPRRTPVVTPTPTSPFGTPVPITVTPMPTATPPPNQGGADTSKKQILLVHGWNGGTGIGGASSCTTSAIKYTNLQSNKRPLGDLGDWFTQDGYDVWYAFLTTSFLNTPSFQQNAECLKNQILSVWGANGRKKIVVVAHSMGGDVTAWCVQDADCAKAVEVIVTYGTPHKGTPMADLKKLAVLGGACAAGGVTCLAAAVSQSCFNDWGACDMNPDVISLTHDSHPNRDGIRYFYIGGSSSFFTNSDGVVGRDSSLALPPESVGWATNVFGRFEVHEKHSSLVPSFLNSYYEPVKDGLRSAAYYCTLKAIKGGDLYDNLCAGLATPRVQALTTEPSYSSSTPLLAGVVAGGQTITRELAVDGEGDVMFVLGSFGGNLDWKVIDPLGVSYGNPISNTIALSNANAGNWKIVVSNSSASEISFGYFAYYNEAITLSARFDANVHKVGETVQITAILSRNGEAVTGSSATVYVTNPDASTATKTLTELQPGIYTGQMQVKGPSGLASFRIYMAGSFQGISFAKDETLILTVQDSTKVFGNFRGYDFTDRNSNGIPDTLRVKQEVYSTNNDGKSVTVQAIVTTDSGEFADSVTLNTSSGTNLVLLEFPFESLQTSSVVRLIELRLLDGNSVLLASTPKDLLITLPAGEPTVTPMPTATQSATPTPTATSPQLDAPTSTATPTPTVTDASPPTSTATPTPTATGTLVSTPTSTATNTPTLTETPDRNPNVLPEQGGILASNIGNLEITVAFPPGAVDEPVIVMMQPTNNPPELGTFKLLGQIFTIEAFTRAGQPVSTFKKNYTISIHYRDADLADLPKEKLAVFYWAENNSWLAVDRLTQDPVNNMLTATLNHLTIFAVLGKSQNLLYLPIITR